MATSKPSKTTKCGRSREQRQAEREALLAQLREKVDALTNTAEWLAYLRFVGAFRRYSFSNVL